MVQTGIAWVGHLLQTAKAFLRGTSTGRAGGFPIQKKQAGRLKKRPARFLLL